MKGLIEQQLAAALEVLQANGTVPADIRPAISVSRTRDSSHGDFASNLAMMLAKPAGRAPRDIAHALIDALPGADAIREVVIAGPGFINFFQVDEAQNAVVATVLSQADAFGRSQTGAGKRVQVEFVSANPTGPLHVGHGRGAALGATIANLMEAVGFDVQREYYVNDAGRQMDILNSILDDIKQDLGEFGVHYDRWFSERSLTDDVTRVVDKLEASGHLYEKDGVRWFRSTDFGDDKDRAVVRANGQSTYFASDIAYIDNKLERGFDQVLYVFGADHHGYTARMVAACQALGHSREKLEFLLIQFAILFRSGERVQMSTRSGSFVTIRELRDEVGKDAARFFYVMRKYSQHLDFDLDLAKSQSNDNPVYYVQYAYARICSVMRQLDQRQLVFDQAAGLAAIGRLSETSETELMTLLATYPDLIARAALAHEPHQLTGYLRDLANGLHSYYNAHKVLVEDDELRNARLCLLLAVQQVLGNGLTLIGVSTPEVM
ncbi:arginine--tRNA ligase [Granulosicoccus antarcticus]|uniref:arginine--tRNA ligase n=1 Tax=Granulosicoccus antarcticus TaxID=437505 RepID=UPI000B5A467A|nr:arginine--tRNA ligase [Granulosicoccus antarcticus]